MTSPLAPSAPLTHAPARSPVGSLARALDPRRSLVAGLIWLVVALAASFAISASLWAGGVARQIVVQQHVRRLVLETDQRAADVAQTLGARLAAVNAAQLTVSFARAFDYLNGTYPNQDWVAAADLDGKVIAGNDGWKAAAPVASPPWFAASIQHPWIGVIAGLTPMPEGRWLGDLAVPFKDRAGRTVGVMIGRLSLDWASPGRKSLQATLDVRDSARTWLLDARGMIRVGPPGLLDRPWSGVVLEDPAPLVSAVDATLRYERMTDGTTALVASAPVALGPAGDQAQWQVRLSEPKEQVYQRANALAARILWISLFLGLATASIGALVARHLTDRLRRLTRSAASVGRNEIVRIEVPEGRDEVAQLATVLDKVLDDLRQERSELLALSGELERRVAVRTREVERLAAEARYAAIVRERLKIARELHDTLAHSMMAMLSEIRLLRRLHTHDPAALADELARAEEVAHAGLTEARTAITQMRVNAVRDTGLGPALAQTFSRFLDRTALTGEFTADPDAARFGDERAETLFRMAEEALRNIERHAGAGRVAVALELAAGTHVRLRIRDDGVGFDPDGDHPGHFGLVGLREQAALIGAELDIDSEPQRGTALTVTLRITPDYL